VMSADDGLQGRGAVYYRRLHIRLPWQPEIQRSVSDFCNVVSEQLSFSFACISVLSTYFGRVSSISWAMRSSGILLFRIREALVSNISTDITCSCGDLRAFALYPLLARCLRALKTSRGTLAAA
jgi:hypothetical protein